MKKIIILSIFVTICLGFIGTNILNAQTTGAGSAAVGSETNTPVNNISDPVKLNNPLSGGNIDTIPELIEALLRILLTVGVPIIALAIIYAGFKFVTAQGNSDKLKEAKDTFVWVIVGAAILLSAYAIATGIAATITDIRGGA